MFQVPKGWGGGRHGQSPSMGMAKEELPDPISTIAPGASDHPAIVPTGTASPNISSTELNPYKLPEGF